MAKYTAEQIAQWFINRAALDVDASPDGEYVTHMKVQKLIYFAQGYYYAFFRRPLFDDKIEAWVHGPVVEDVYRKYKRFERGPIVDVKPVDIEDATDAAFLEFIYEKLGRYTAEILSSMSHMQIPYKKNYKANVKNVEIPKVDIFEYFSSLKKISKSAEEFKRKENKLRAMAETSYINSIPEIKERLNNSEDDFLEVDWKNELCD